MTDGKNSLVAISKDVLWDEYYTNMHGAYNSLQSTFSRSGLTQDELATLLDCTKSNISKRLNGRENPTLKSLSFMGTAMQCRLEVRFVPYSNVGKTNYFVSTAVHSIRFVQTTNPNAPMTVTANSSKVVEPI